MKLAFLLCVTAIAIVFIHDVAGPVTVFSLQLDLAREIDRIQKNASKPSLEIIPGITPKFRAAPELRKEKL